MKYKVLLFDADNTLFDFDACEKRALKLVFERHGILLDAQMNACFHSINNDLLEAALRSGRAASRDDVVLYPFSGSSSIGFILITTGCRLKELINVNWQTGTSCCRMLFRLYRSCVKISGCFW